jgi:Putative esterase
MMRNYQTPLSRFASALIVSAVAGLAACAHQPSKSFDETERVNRAVAFEIDMRAEIAAKRFDPSKDQIGIRGAAPPLSWQQSVIATPSGNGRFKASATFIRPAVGGQAIQYKFKIERPGSHPNEGWEEGRNRIVLSRVEIETVARAFNTAPDTAAIERTGNIERIAPLPSKFVLPREVQVWLPPGYETDTTRRYPVLYLHDGQNMFDAAASGAE